jgi:hypothetical protein
MKYPAIMETSFWIKLGLSFAVGRAWVTMSSIAAERYGSKIGGLNGVFVVVLISLVNRRLGIGLAGGAEFSRATARHPWSVE